jgi:hypothetical protein
MFGVLKIVKSSRLKTKFHSLSSEVCETKSTEVGSVDSGRHAGHLLLAMIARVTTRLALGSKDDPGRHTTLLN